MQWACTVTSAAMSRRGPGSRCSDQPCPPLASWEHSGDWQLWQCHVVWIICRPFVVRFLRSTSCLNNVTDYLFGTLTCLQIAPVARHLTSTDPGIGLLIIPRTPLYFLLPNHSRSSRASLPTH